MTFNYKHPKWEKLRLKVLRRDNWTCKFCGQLCLGKKRNGHSPTVDHIKSVKDHPDLAFDPRNMQVLCKPCDNKKHAEKGRKDGVDIQPVGEDGFPLNSEWS